MNSKMMQPGRLAELGKPAVGRLLELLKDPEEVTRKQAILAPGRNQG